MTVTGRGLRFVLVALVAACSGPTLPVAGTLKVHLTTPNNGQDGAALLVLSGPAVPVSVTPGSGLVLWGGPVQTATATIAITGTLSTGTILTLQVEDINQVNHYSVLLKDVAALSDSLRPAPLSAAGYSVAVTR